MSNLIHSEGFPVLLTFVTPPSQTQLDGLKQFVAKRYGRSDAVFELREDASLISGFRLLVANDEYDWSASGRLEQLSQKLMQVKSDSPEQVISL